MPWALLFTLGLTYALAFIDRSIIGLMMRDIGSELSISQTYTALLVGPGFAVVYAVAGVVAALFLSHCHPRRVIGAGVLLWSLATIGCAIAQTPAELLVARMGVGIGEGALVPMAYAWISFRAPPERMGIAMACFTLGVALGGGLSLGVGGHAIEWLSQNWAHGPVFGLSPWRLVLLALGVIGIPIAALVTCVDRVPVAGHGKLNLKADWPPLAPAALLILGFTAVGGTIYVQIFWAREFFAESFGLSLASVALILGIAMGAGGAIGVFIGGEIGDRAARAGVTLPHARMMIYANCIQLVFFTLAFASENFWFAVTAYMIAMTAQGGIGATMGPSIAQLFAPAQRAFVTSVNLAATTGIGLGVIMPVVGALAARYGIREAMLVSSALLLLVSMALLALARSKTAEQGQGAVPTIHA